MCFGYIGNKKTHFQLVMEYGFKTRIPDCPEVEGEWAWTFLFIDICFSSGSVWFVGNNEDFVIVCMYFPRCFFIRSVENITITFSEFLFQYFRFFSLSCFLHWTSVLCFSCSRRRPWNTLQDKILLLIWRASIDVIKLLNNYLWFNNPLLLQKSWLYHSYILTVMYVGEKNCE